MPKDSLLDYVIAGIQDSKVKKSLLYGAITINKFKIKLQLYVKMKSRIHFSESGIFRVSNSAVNNHNTGNMQRNLTSGISNTVIRCFNCGSKIHQHRKCLDLDKCTKCFACRSFGHKSTECPNKKTQTMHMNNYKKPQIYQVSAVNTDERIFKEINVLGIKTLALIDIGYDLNSYRQLLVKCIDTINTKVSINEPAGTIFYNNQKCMTELEIDKATYQLNLLYS
jgi:hypothetical protein